MECYRPIDQQLIDACREYPPDFVSIRKLIALGADVNAVSAVDPDDSVISDIIMWYPEFTVPKDEADLSDAPAVLGHCAGRADGRYLPQIIQFFLENGFDVAKDNGMAGARALEALKLSSYDRYILDGCKLLLHAGADPSVSTYSDDAENVLDSVAAEASFQGSEGDHRLENLFETMYQIMEAQKLGKSFWLMEYYDVCIGRRVDRIKLCSGKDPLTGVFPVDQPTFHHQNCFVDTVVLDCEGKQLCVSRYADLLVDPHIPQNAAEQMDLTAWLPDCVGHIITAIDFDHASIREEDLTYGQPIILIRLDNGKTIRFSVNYGEVPKGDMVAWFAVE